MTKKKWVEALDYRAPRTPEAKSKATQEGLVLVKVLLQGKHAGQDRYSVSMAMKHEEALLIAAICNIVSQGREIPSEVHALLGVQP